MEVLLTHAYYLQRDLHEQAIMKPYPPLGLLYISAWLEKFNIVHEVYDSTFHQPNDQYQFILQHKPKIIGIYTNLVSKIEVIRLMKFIRQDDTLANALIVLGGPDVSYNVENYLHCGADVLVIGEGEQTFVEVVLAWQNNPQVNFTGIAGIAFRNPEGLIEKTPARSKLKDLDQLPWPNRKKIDLSTYLDAWKKHHGKHSITISTQRGCPYTCRWCSVAVYGQSYRRRSPVQVVQEMLHLKEIYQPDQVWFVDDVFTISHRWLEEFNHEVHQHAAVIPFECITRADRLNEQVLRLLKTSGCFRVWIGAESGSQTILDAMDRRVQATYVQDMIRTAKNIGLETGTFIMLGYPGETEQDILMTRDHLLLAQPDLFTITIAYPIKGTPLYDSTERTHQKNLERTTTTDRDIDFKRTYARPYYTFALIWISHTMALSKLNSKGYRFSFKYLTHLGKWVTARLLMHLIKLTS